MLVLKKVVALGAAIAALSIPSLALADDHNGDCGRNDRHADATTVRLQNDIARDRAELARDQRFHRWEEAARARREHERHERELRDRYNHNRR